VSKSQRTSRHALGRIIVDTRARTDSRDHRSIARSVDKKITLARTLSRRVDRVARASRRRRPPVSIAVVVVVSSHREDESTRAVRRRRDARRRRAGRFIDRDTISSRVRAVAIDHASRRRARDASVVDARG
jgi:hypothetical protein